MNISNNTVLITGGTSGIGLELATQLLNLGNTVLITGRDQAKLDEAKRHLPKVHIFKSDVSDPQAILALFSEVTQKFPALNMLINNAGIMRKINLQKDDTDLLALTHEIEVNLMGPMRMVQQFLPFLKRQPTAAIVNVSSGLAFVPLAMSPVYCATKAGLHSYTQSLRVQLKNTSVQVFELAPPAIETPLFRGSFTAEDTQGIKTMAPAALVEHMIAALRANVLEIRPGMSNSLKWMSRIAPEWAANLMGKSADRMIAEKI